MGKTYIIEKLSFGGHFMKIVAIVGSLRKESYNKKIAKFMMDRYKGNLDIDILSIDNLPLFNEEIEKNPPTTVVDFKSKVKESEGVLIVTPEYNHSIPGVLKNALDWCSRVDRVMVNKPTFIVGASNGNVGTARCQAHLRQVLNSGGISAIDLPGNQVLIADVQDKFDEAGEFIDERTIKYLDKVVNNYIKWAEKVK